LADLKSLTGKNRGIRYILLVVAVLSKRIWLRAARNKTSAVIAKLMRDILENDMPVAPRRCQTDEGLEFFGSPWRNLMKEYNIIHFATGSKDTKASLAEVNIREIKRIIFRMITQTGNEKYVDKLPEIESGHNARIHPRTGFRPIDVNEENAPAIFRKLFPNVMKNALRGVGKRSPLVANLPFQKGDRVIVAKNFQQFRHGYLSAWNPEVYEVSAVLPENTPPRYRLSQDGERILGLWYAQELQKVESDENKQK